MKILGFDSWTGGFRNYKRLNKEFVLNDITFKLLHISKWSNLEIKEKEFGNISTRDVSNYKTLDFDKILKIEKPEAVVLLSVDVFAHKSMIRACKRQNIPVVHLFHGIMSALSVEEKVTYSKSLISKILFALPRLPKYARYVVPNYFLSLYRDNLSLKEILFFFRTLSKQLDGKNVLKENHDSHTNLCIVFHQLDGEYAMSKYGYLKEEIRIVGNPDLYEFNFLENYINSYEYEPKREYVLYLDSVPFLRGFMTKEENLIYLLKLNKEILKKGKKLVIKLHPEHKQTNFGEVLTKEGVKIVDKDDLIDFILKSDYVISEATSIFQIPALIGAPIYLSSVEAFNNQSYGKLISSYPRAYGFKSFDELGTKHYSREDINKWVKDNIGPLPFDGFPKRVVNEFLNLIND